MSQFKEGFIIGWMESVGSQEQDKLKLREIAEAASRNRPSPSGWISFPNQPFDGQVVLLRMVETSENKNIHYGVGWYDAQKKSWVVTAPPKTDTSLDVMWLC